MRLLTITAASDEENLERWLLEFEKRFHKTSKGFFDPEVVESSLKRWQSENRKKNPRIKKNPLEYRDVDELNEAMESLRTKDEVAIESRKKAKEGTRLREKIGPYSIYAISNPEALLEFSLKNTSWCTKGSSEAEEEFESKGAPFVITHKKDSVFVIFPEVGEVWHNSDVELYGNSEWNTEVPVIPKQDFKVLQRVMDELYMNPLEPNSKVFQVEA